MEEMLERYAAAVRAKDVDAFVELYADDVRTFDLWQEWTYDGKDALRGMVAEWFGSLAGRRGRGRAVRRRPHPDRLRRGRGQRVHHLCQRVSRRHRTAVDEQPPDLDPPAGARRRLEDRATSTPPHPQATRGRCSSAASGWRAGRTRARRSPCRSAAGARSSARGRRASPPTARASPAAGRARTAP